MKDLIKKYEIQSEVLLKIMQSTYSNEEEIEKAAVARRFVTGFIYDLKAMGSDELTDLSTIFNTVVTLE